jgi:hypothetical protein
MNATIAWHAETGEGLHFVVTSDDEFGPHKVAIGGLEDRVQDSHKLSPSTCAICDDHIQEAFTAIRRFNGRVKGTTVTGISHIEFPTMDNAASWADTCAVSERVTARVNDRPYRFNEPVSILFDMLASSERLS